MNNANTETTTSKHSLPPAHVANSTLESHCFNIQVHNIVCSVNLGCQLDLPNINNRLRLSEYNPKRFPGAVLRLLDPKVTALTFASGKMVICGAKHESLAGLGVKKLARILQKLGYNINLKEFKISNMLGTCNLKFAIDLEKLNEGHAQFSRYEPELFPALIYRVIEPRTVMLVFVNGKVVITGAKSRKELQSALDSMINTFRMYQKK